MKQPLNEQFRRMQKLAGIITENKVNFQSYLSEETKKGTYQLTKSKNGLNYLYLYLGYDMPETDNSNWTVLTSQDGEIFSRKIGYNDSFESLLKNLPSVQQDSNTLTVSLDDIKSIFSLREKKKEIVKINNKYVIKDKEFSDDYGDFYAIDKQKALKYLSQFNNKDVDAGQFINDDEGWGEFEQYLKNVESMSNEDLEDAMRSEMSFYYFSNPDELGESKLNKNQIQEMDMDIKTILANNGINDDYFESMGGKEIETGTEEWLDILSDVTGKDAYTAEFDEADEAKIQVFMQKLEALGIELI